MANTTNFGWETPDDTDLVKDGALAMRTLGNAIDTSLVDLKGGTTNQVLAKNSNTDLDFKWVADATGIPATIIDAKGDLIVGTAADTAGRLAVGTNDFVLTAASGETTGLKWASVVGPAFRAVRATTNQSFAQSTFVKIQYNAETFDTDNCFDSTTNYRFTPNKAGYYQLNVSMSGGFTAGQTTIGKFYKNGTVYSTFCAEAPDINDLSVSGADLVYLNGTTDYVEVYVYHTGATRNITVTNENQFSGTFIRS